MKIKVGNKEEREKEKYSERKRERKRKIQKESRRKRERERERERALWRKERVSMNQSADTDDSKNGGERKTRTNERGRREI